MDAKLCQQRHSVWADGHGLSLRIHGAPGIFHGSPGQVDRTSYDAEKGKAALSVIVAMRFVLGNRVPSLRSG